MIDAQDNLGKLERQYQDKQRKAEAKKRQQVEAEKCQQAKAKELQKAIHEIDLLAHIRAEQERKRMFTILGLHTNVTVP